jgi:hypothetical protein
MFILISMLLLACKAYINPLQQKIESIKNIQEMPYIPELSGDKIYWEIVKEGKNAIPYLINKIDDETPTDAVVPNIGGNHVVGDIAILILQNIVRDIPIISCVGGSEKNGSMDYWRFVRSNTRNRRYLKDRVRGWYLKNKDRLEWKADTRVYRASADWPYENKNHPAGGYYISNSPQCE